MTAPIDVYKSGWSARLSPFWPWDWDNRDNSPPVPPGPHEIYSWPVENQDDKGFSYGVMGGDSPADPFAMISTYQGLVLPQGGKLTSVKLWVRNQSAGAGYNVCVQVSAAAGAPGVIKPTGAILATSEVIASATLNSVDGSLQEFLFTGPNQIILQAGQTYAFIFTYSGAFLAQGHQIYVGLNWVATLPNNVGFNQGGWESDDYGTLTLYIYAE